MKLRNTYIYTNNNKLCSKISISGRDEEGRRGCNVANGSGCKSVRQAVKMAMVRVSGLILQLAAIAWLAARFGAPGRRFFVAPPSLPLVQVKTGKHSAPDAEVALFACAVPMLLQDDDAMTLQGSGLAKSSAARR